MPHTTIATKARLPLHVIISTLFLILLLLVGGLIGGLGYTVSRDILKSSANALSERVGRETLREFSGLVGPAEMAARLLSRSEISLAGSLEQRLEYLGFMHEALGRSSELTALYMAYGNGDIFLLRRIASAAERDEFAAPEQTVFIVQSIDHPAGKPRGRFIFLDSTLKPLRSDERPDYAAAYDPRARDWYQAALTAHGQIVTPPHVLFTTRRLGTTIAKRAQGSEAVAAADISLRTFERALAEQKVTPGTQIVLTNPSAQIIGSEDDALLGRALDGRSQALLEPLAESGIPVLAQLAPRVQGITDETPQNLELKVAGELWHVTLNPLHFEGSGALVLITAIPDRELMSAAYTLLRHAGVVMALVILLAIPLIWATARAVAQPLRKLAGEVDAIRHFEFSQPIGVDSKILEVGELAQTIAQMKRTISRFLELSQTVAAENDFDRLLPHLLGETIAAADADAGILYLADDAGRLLPASGQMADGRALPASVPGGDPAQGSPLFKRALAAQTACSGQLSPADIAALGLAAALDACGASHAIAVPLQNRKHLLVGAMLLLRQGETDSARLSFIGALSGSVAVSLEAKESIRAQKQLFEALVKLIAGAIDAKSPYTGGHCARVPEIAKLLARAACAQGSGPYRDFTLDEDQWEALHLAAWLHDCGKVTTPEYVVDKATKLEGLYDRIHEVRMRFEVIKRDAHIACLEAIAAGQPEAAARTALAQQWAQLDDDYAFVAACNEGGEFMAPDRQQRLHAIAARSWLRTLDDRIGTSREERKRKSRTPAPPLPVREALLADKPEQRIERDAGDAIADAALGIRMSPPELYANRGELYNLTIERGTLTAEERYKINEHIVQTLVMLARLPFPKHLRQVPEIAGGHHEKIDGTGYPKQLRGNEMSPLARMMAIADIFEALTAADRPYKKGKTLSEAIAIMTRMKDDGHIDAELFAIFVSSGVHLDYARRFMRPEQIDAVDLADGPEAVIAHSAAR